MRKMITAAFVATILASAGEAAAECVCGCIDGQPGLICRDSMQTQPTCAPRVCPPPQLFAAPLLASSTPPPGTTQCYMAQVLTLQADRYEWLEVCR
jgi:hypothetical protein